VVPLLFEVDFADTLGFKALLAEVAPDVDDEVDVCKPALVAVICCGLVYEVISLLPVMLT
jgi:hypothetical protein